MMKSTIQLDANSKDKQSNWVANSEDKQPNWMTNSKDKQSNWVTNKLKKKKKVKCRSWSKLRSSLKRKVESQYNVTPYM